jgi:dimethylamine/trimethylamine dehydrogenase
MLAEASTVLGGRVAQECKLPGLAEWGRVRDYRVLQIQTMPNVDIFLDNDMNAVDVLNMGTEHIVVATGARWRDDGFGRYHKSPCLTLGPSQQIFTPDDILNGCMPQGRVLLFDDDHYYMGSVLAEALIASGAEVCLVTPENMVCAWGVNSDEQFQTQQHLIELGVRIITAHGLDEFDGNSARLSCIYTQRTQAISADAVVLVTARTPMDSLYREITAKIESGISNAHPTVHKIGDCDAPAIIAAAIYAGHRYARELDEDMERVISQDRLFDPD